MRYIYTCIYDDKYIDILTIFKIVNKLLNYLRAHENQRFSFRKQTHRTIRQQTSYMN